MIGFLEFVFKKTEENEFVLQITDKSKIGTYATVVQYLILYDKKKLNYKIVGKKLMVAKGEKIDENFVKLEPIYFLE